MIHMADCEEEVFYTDLRSKIIAVTEQEMKSKSVIERKAYAEAAYFLMNDVFIEEGDIFAGKLEKCHFVNIYPTDMKEELEYLIRSDRDTNKKYQCMLIAEEIGLFTRTPGAHVVPAYDRLIQEGISHRIDQIRYGIKICTDKAQQNFYRAELSVLKAMQGRIIKYGEEAERRYGICGGENLKRIQNSCNRIAFVPPENFHEALQLILLAHEHVLAEGESGSISFGRLDQYLYPFYKRDLDKARITKEDGQEMITAFWRKISEYEMGWQNVTLGGSNSEGEDQCNDLTLFSMNASLIVRRDQPQISLRVHKNMPEHVWKKAFELIQTGMGFPELYHDDIAVKAKQNVGISKEDAWNYSIVGCVELTAGGKEYSHTEGARINWQKLLELMLNEGTCQITGLNWKLAETHKLDEFHEFGSFYEWYKRELKHFTEFVCGFVLALSRQYGTYWPVPFVSSMMEGCIERGMDITNGGTVYNNLTLNCVGIATVADSLESIEKLVFKERLLNLKELVVVLKKNFVGYEAVHRKMIGYPKYGNDISSVDYKVRELTEVFVETLAEASKKQLGKVFQAGFYTSYFHATMGKQTGASPDGRKSGDALSPSLSPTAGMDRNGPTAVINSASHINMEGFGNGMVLDLKLMANFFQQEKYQQAVRMLIEEYFSRGGLEIQFNTLDKETLSAAQKDPYKYRNLIVRVSGFSAYFVALEESLQNEIIRRTEHQIA